MAEKFIKKCFKLISIMCRVIVLYDGPFSCPELFQLLAFSSWIEFWIHTLC